MFLLKLFIWLESAPRSQRFYRAMLGRARLFRME